jgi:hypothetical protein
MEFRPVFEYLLVQLISRIAIHILQPLQLMKNKLFQKSLFQSFDTKEVGQS